MKVGIMTLWTASFNSPRTPPHTSEQEDPGGEGPSVGGSIAARSGSGPFTVLSHVLTLGTHSHEFLSQPVCTLGGTGVGKGICRRPSESRWHEGRI